MIQLKCAKFHAILLSNFTLLFYAVVWVLKNFFAEKYFARNLRGRNTWSFWERSLLRSDVKKMFQIIILQPDKMRDVSGLEQRQQLKKLLKRLFWIVLQGRNSMLFHFKHILTFSFLGERGVFVIIMKRIFWIDG